MNWDKHWASKRYAALGLCANEQKLSDWYTVSRAEVQARGGKALLYHYDSLGKALKAVYPQYQWDMSRFNTKDHSTTHPHRPPWFWSDKNNLLAALESAGKRLGMKEVWYNHC